MVQIITREWEITKTFIFEVVMKEGVMKIDWNDFESNAQHSKPAVAVKVDEPLGISEMMDMAFEEMMKNLTGTLTSVMIIISYRLDQNIMMAELGGMNESFSRLSEEEVEIVWCIQEADDITNSRSITVFAFEKL